MIGLAAAGAFFWAGATGRLDDDEGGVDSNPQTSPYSEAEVGDCVAVPRSFGWKPERGIYFCFVGEVGKKTVGSVFQSDR